MKRILATAVTLIALSMTANAQYRDFTYDNQSLFRLIQVDQYEDATIFFFDIEATSDRMKFSLNDNTSLDIPGTYKRYRVKSVGNLPYSSEDANAILLKTGQKLNFVIEFDRIPLDKAFNIIENESENGNLDFNFRNIKINTESVSEKIDVADFLNYTDYVLIGDFVQGDRPYRFYSINGLSVATCLEEEWYGFTRVGKLSLSIVNDTANPVKVSATDIEVKATKNESKGYEDLSIWTVDTYMSLKSDEDASRVSNYRNEINPVASSVAKARKEEQNNKNVGGAVAYGILEDILRSNDDEKINNFKEGLRKNRERIWNNYLKTLTLNSGETYGGFVAFRDRNYKRYVITIRMGGHEYEFGVKG